jgi:hypothetical protein
VNVDSSVDREVKPMSVMLLAVLTTPKHQLTSSERDGSDAEDASGCRWQGTRLRGKAIGSRTKSLSHWVSEPKKQGVSLIEPCDLVKILSLLAFLQI